MDSPLLAVPGAVAGTGRDAAVPEHYGDPLREQRRAAEGLAVVDRSHRGVLAVSGPDRLSWLHSLTSQHLADRGPGTGTEALVLSPHGHVEHHLLLAEDGETVWVDVEPGGAPGLLAYLDSMRFLLRVEPRDVTADWAVATLLGPAAAAAAGGVAEGSVAPAFGGLARGMAWPLPGSVDLLLPRARLADLAELTGAELAGHGAFEAHRVAAGRPRLGAETDHRTIPHEVGWIGSAVHLDKGCYRGQETVARVQNLGRPPRRLVRLHLDGTTETLPATGDPVEVAGRPVGFVGTAVRHYELGPVALAVVRRTVPDGSAATAGGVPAQLDAEPVVAAEPVRPRAGASPARR